MRSILVLVVLAATAIGCNSDDPLPSMTVGADDGGAPLRSGIDPSLRLVELGVEEMTQLCQWTVQLQGGPGTHYDCRDHGLNLVVASVDQCVSARERRTESCDYTVGRMEECMNAFVVDACGAIGAHPACQQPMGCLMGD